MLTKKIYMLAHFGDFQKKAADGGQTSARRFLNTLRKLGYKVSVTNRKSKISDGTRRGKIYPLMWGIVAMSQFLLKIMIGDRGNSITLSICYCGPMMPFDATAAFIAKKFGYRHVMYIKGGQAKLKYDGGSHFYRKMFVSSLKNSHLILSECYENLAFCSKLCPTNVVYIPNYTEDGFAPDALPVKPKDNWNFVYFGRMCEEKNVLLIIQIFNKVSSVIKNTTLTLIGKGDEEYMSKIKFAIAHSSFSERIMLYPVILHDDLKDVLRKQHFFLFPSIGVNEGHSNALNEAMSWGVVPLVSNNKFLPSIVGDDNLVINSANDAKPYVDAITNIIDSDKFGFYSTYVFNRVKSQFTQSVVETRMLNSLNIGG